VKLSQLLTAPNQLTLLRMMFLPFVVIKLVEGHYTVALTLFVLAGLSDGLDGLLARTLKQQTVLGQYLDPIADKLLLSTMFMVLSILHKIPWKFTVVVFSRDISILLASAVLYAIAGLRDFSPSIFGKANTFAQVAAVFFVLLLEVAMGCDRPPVVLACDLFLHHYFGHSLRTDRGTAAARFASCCERVLGEDRDLKD
jgi:cardiolipin synthase (CMP-forming)